MVKCVDFLSTCGEFGAPDTRLCHSLSAVCDVNTACLCSSQSLARLSPYLAVAVLELYTARLCLSRSSSRDTTQPYMNAACRSGTFFEPHTTRHSL